MTNPTPPENNRAPYSLMEVLGSAGLLMLISVLIVVCCMLAVFAAFRGLPPPESTPGISITPFPR